MVRRYSYKSIISETVQKRSQFYFYKDHLIYIKRNYL